MSYKLGQYYLHLGQYRMVEGGYDGDSVYQCMWCKNTLRICDDPRYWNFCPKCGKSWFEPMKCRLHTVPRWYWDRFKTNHYNSDHPWNPPYKLPTHQWVMWQRCRWCNQEWEDWKVDHKFDKDPFKPDWKWALSILRERRLWHSGDGESITFEYKMTLEKKDD